jgi:hypothetical protein
MALLQDDEELKRKALAALSTQDDSLYPRLDSGADATPVAAVTPQPTPRPVDSQMPGLRDTSDLINQAKALEAPQPPPNRVEQIIHAITAGMEGFAGGLSGGPGYFEHEAQRQKVAQEQQQNRLARAKELRQAAKEQEQTDIAEQQRWIENRRADTAEHRANAQDARQVAQDKRQASMDQATLERLQLEGWKSFEDATGQYLAKPNADGTLSKITVAGPKVQQKTGDDLQTYLASKEAERGRPSTAAEKTTDIERFKTLGPLATAAVQQQQLNKVPALTTVPKELVTHASDENDKASNAWLEAHQRGEDLGAFINAARKGNKVAGAYAPVEQVMFTNASQGIKRINDTELRAVKGAGDAKDRVESFFNHYTTGQPIPEGILNDMDTIRQAIMKSADSRFTQKTTFTNKNTGASFETDPYKAHGVDVPFNGTPPGKVVTPGSTGGWSVKVIK